MPYRRRSKRSRPRRSRKARRRGRGVNKKRLVKLIKAVSFSTQETKKFVAAYNVVTAVPITSSIAWGAVTPLLYDLPRANNTTQRSDVTFDGNKIYLKGIKLWPVITLSSTSSTAPVTGARVRCTLISTTDRIAAVTGGVGWSNIPNNWYEEGSANPTTYNGWNTERVKVVKTWTWVLNFAGGFTHMRSMKRYLKFGAWKTTEAGSSTTSNTYWGDCKGVNPFFVMEVYNGGPQPLSTSTFAVSLDKYIYFKDA